MEGKNEKKKIKKVVPKKALKFGSNEKWNVKQKNQ